MAHIRLILAALAVVILTACGGGTEDPAEVPERKGPCAQNPEKCL